MANHSPGPWTIKHDGGDRTLIDAGGSSLMNDTSYYPSCPTSDEDWNLIAAAPELLEALKAAIGLATIGEVPAEVTLQRWDAAIAKADGKGPTMANFTPGPWRRGCMGGAVVADHPVPEIGGSGDVEHYGGHLIAESVAPQNVPLIAAAPEMYQALKAAEWGGNRGEPVCPVCRRLNFEKHRKDCILANAIAKAEAYNGD